MDNQDKQDKFDRFNEILGNTAQVLFNFSFFLGLIIVPPMVLILIFIIFYKAVTHLM